MDRLIKMYGEHREMGVPPEVEAAWLHHRFARIHPFQEDLKLRSYFGFQVVETAKAMRYFAEGLAAWQERV